MSADQSSESMLVIVGMLVMNMYVCVCVVLVRSFIFFHLIESCR